MLIQIVNTSVETKPTQKGSYQQLEVVYKNLTYQGKIESKKIMSFGANAGAFKALSAAQAGQTFEVSVVKNAQGYNDWTDVKQSTGEVAAAAAPKTSPAPKSTYETPEERAQRQVLIVRQSSVDRALAYHSIGAKTPPDLETVFKTAQEIVDFVFQVKAPGATGFDDLPDFEIPSVE